MRDEMMSDELIRQPAGTSLCGQCVVAMLAGVPLESVVAVMGDKANYPANLRKGAKKFGVKLPARSKPGTVTPPMEGKGAAFIWGAERGHWVAWSRGIWFDPAATFTLSTIEHYKPQAIGLYEVQP